MSSELLNLVTDSPFIARLQVMTLAKDSSRSKFGLKQVFFFLTSKNTLSSSALECGITRINFTTLVSLGNFGHPMQSFHSAKIMQHTIVKNIFNGLDNFCFRWRNINFFQQLKVMILMFFILFWTAIRQELRKPMRNYVAITKMFSPRNINRNFLICNSSSRYSLNARSYWARTSPNSGTQKKWGSPCVQDQRH